VTGERADIPEPFEQDFNLDENVLLGACHRKERSL
jgi:hypothetical protein